MSEPLTNSDRIEAVEAGKENAPLVSAVIRERLRAGHDTQLRVQGKSMQPYLVAGQSVLVQPCSAALLRPGDLVAFEQSNQVILHRVLAVDAGSNQVVEKGDNVRYATTIEADRVLGRAVAVFGTQLTDLKSFRHSTPARLISWLGRAQHRAAVKMRSWPLLAWPLFAFITVLLRTVAFLARPSQ